MKYLFSLIYYSPYVSGISVYVKRLAEELAKKGHGVSVICYQHDKNTKSHESISGVNVVRVTPQIKISKGFLSLDWIWMCWKQVKLHDLVFVNLPQPEGLITAFIARLQNKKLFSIYHCDVYLPSNKLAQNITRITAWLTLVLSKQVISYTQDYAIHSPVLKHFLKKIVYCYPPFVKLSKSKDRKPKVATIGVAARLAQEKGIEYLLEAIKDIDCQLVVAGPLDPVGEEFYKQKIMKLVEPLKDRIIFLGTIPPEDMSRFYSQIDVLVLPSVNSTEAFGMVQVEAMQAGIPVIATNLPGVRTPIQLTNAGLLVRPKSTTELKIAILEVLKNRRRYLPSPQKINEIFSLEKTLKTYEAF